MGRFFAIGALAFLALGAGRAWADEPVDKVVKELRTEVDRLKAKVAGLEARLEKKGPAKSAVPVEPTEPTSGELAAAMDRLASANVSAPGIRGLRIGGQVRLQGEENRDYELDSHRGGSKDFVRQRIRVSFDFDVSNAVRIFTKFQDARVSGGEHSVATDLGRTDLKEGYIDFVFLQLTADF